MLKRIAGPLVTLVVCILIFLLCISEACAENSITLRKGDEFNVRKSEKIEHRGKVYLSTIDPNRYETVRSQGKTYWTFRRQVRPIATKTRRGESPLPEQTQERLMQTQWIGVDIDALPNRHESQIYDRRYEVSRTFKIPGKSLSYRLGSPSGDRMRTRTEPTRVIFLLEVPE